MFSTFQILSFTCPLSLPICLIKFDNAPAPSSVFSGSHFDLQWVSLLGSLWLASLINFVLVTLRGLTDCCRCYVAPYLATSSLLLKHPQAVVGCRIILKLSLVSWELLLVTPVVSCSLVWTTYLSSQSSARTTGPVVYTFTPRLTSALWRVKIELFMTTGQSIQLLDERS